MPSSLRLSILASGATMLMVVALFYGESNLVKAIALASVIIVFWLTDVIPLYVTALIPLALAGPMGLLTGEQISSAYAHKFVFLFLGGFVIALAMEKRDVNKQIALGFLRLVGK